MTKTATKRKVDMPAGIRTKLTAATVMLLIAAILMVSTTYAWFTLSTAPEVTGITTNVGANGNLEMLLLNKDSFKSTEDDLGVVSEVGDSNAVKALTEANLKWGNLVDLSDASYGLDNIVLMPSRLNLATASTLDSTVLLAPSYGTDGRVIDVNTATYSGAREGNSWVYKSFADYAGVRALGTSSGVTQRLSAYRTAKSAVTTNISAAKSAAQQSLTSNGQNLANIVMRHAMANADEAYTLDEIRSLQNMINALQTANDKAGAAIVQAVLANSLSAAQGTELTDAQVTALADACAAATPSTVGAIENVVPPTGFDAAKAQWEANNQTIGQAKNDVDALVAQNKASYAYAEIEGVVDQLINKNHTTVAGVKNPGRDDLQTIIDNVTAAQMTVVMEMEDGAGIYADIAKLVGDFTASGFKVKVTKDSLTITADVVIKTTGHDSPLISAITVGEAPAATVGGAGTTTILTDTYGYALDFGFRTNAAASNLLLQTDAAQRVYSDSEAENTQGGGSYMQFTTTNAKTFSVTEVRALMSALRVAFVAPQGTDDATQYDILGIAKLDITSVTDQHSGITTYTGGTIIDKDGKALADGATDTTTGAAGIKAKLALYDYTLNGDGTLTIGAAKGNGVLKALTQNHAEKVTAIVYLDGDIVDNTMVANAAESMSGKLNLQFASSATLKPMENTNMREGGSPSKDAPKVTYTQKAVAGDSYSVGGVTGTVKAGYTIYEGSDGNLYFSTNGTRYTRLTESNATYAITVTSNP